MKRKKYIDKDSEKVLKEFLKCKIPKRYYVLQDVYKYPGVFTYGDIDYMFSFEEVFQYATFILDGFRISLDENFVNTKSVAINDEFIVHLERLPEQYPEMSEFCDKFIEAIKIIKEYAI